MAITAFWLASYWFIQGRIIQAPIGELFPWWPDSTGQPLIKGPCLLLQLHYTVPVTFPHRKTKWQWPDNYPVTGHLSEKN